MNILEIDNHGEHRPQLAFTASVWQSLPANSCAYCCTSDTRTLSTSLRHLFGIDPYSHPHAIYPRVSEAAEHAHLANGDTARQNIAKESSSSFSESSPKRSFRASTTFDPGADNPTVAHITVCAATPLTPIAIPAAARRRSTQPSTVCRASHARWQCVQHFHNHFNWKARSL